MKYVFVTLGLLALAGAADAQPDTLDRPIPRGAPTLRSEIARGHDAGFACSLQANMPREWESFQNCIDEAQRTNRQRIGRGFEAFDVGLYYEAKQDMQLVAGVLKKSDFSQSTFGQMDLKGVELALDLDQSAYEKARTATHLSDAGVRRALSSPP